MAGIVSYGAYVPYWRLSRQAIAASLGTAPAKGTRSVASYDEDTTSMGVEASRMALAAAPAGYQPHNLWFATTAPAYLDKTNATAIHAALALSDTAGAFDVIGSVRSGVGAMFGAGSGGSQIGIVSDIRVGLPGGAEESAGGDAAAALCFGTDEVVAEVIGGAQVTEEFLDRWRVPGEVASRQWEERFGEHAYGPLGPKAFSSALDGAGLRADQIDHLVVSGLHTRAVKALPKALGVRPEAVADDLGGTIGNTGAAHWVLNLCDVLDRAQPDQIIAVVILADGANVWLLRTTAALVAMRARARSTVAAQLAATRDDLSYSSMLTWRGLLHREPPRRPEPDRPAAPPSARRQAWKFAFVGSRDETGFVHLPPSRISTGTGAVDVARPVRMADERATIATYTVDRLAYSLSPPVVAAVIDFDGGGRVSCELTDVDPDRVRIGDRVEMTFRRLYTQDGVHNYFWKARPLRGSAA